MQAFYSNKPSKLEAVGNGSYLYRWNITELEPVEREGQENGISNWECEEVVIWKPLSSNKITETVISEKWGNDYEQKLINEYNAIQMGITDGAAKEKGVNLYKEFLLERSRIKRQIDADCMELGIR